MIAFLSSWKCCQKSNSFIKNARWGLFMRVNFVCLQVDGPINRVVWGWGAQSELTYVYVGCIFQLHFLAGTI